MEAQDFKRKYISSETYNDLDRLVKQLSRNQKFDLESALKTVRRFVGISGKDEYLLSAIKPS